MEQITIKPQLPSFFSLIKECFQVYKSKWKVLLLLFLISYAITYFSAGIIAAIIAAPAVFVSFFKSKEMLWLTIGLFSLVAIILIAIMSSWLQAGIIMILKDRAETLRFREILRRAKPFIFPYVWVTLITLPIIILGFIFFAIPGIIFSIWFLFTKYVLISENKKGLAAIAASREYVRGYFGKILLLVLTAMFLMIFIMSIFESLSKNLPMGNYIHSAISILVAPLPLIYYYLIYEHLKKIKGDTVATPTAKQKNFIAILAASGTIVIIAIAGLLIYFAPQIENYYKIEMKKYEAQTGNQLPPLPQNQI
jgi:hypothetical protein